MYDHSNIHKQYIFKHISFALINLLLVALAGTTLRYKIIFPLPWIDQGHLLHAHSHFAFTGWISHILMTLIILYINPDSDKKNNIFKSILTLNLVTSYGMLVSFALQGYAFISITFSFLSILISFVFGYHVFKEDRTDAAFSWFKAAAFFNMLSSIGTFTLAYQMAKGMSGNGHLASVYFYLHFQYNGWFFFAAMGLFISLLSAAGNRSQFLRSIFWLFCIACVGTYLLSLLWLKLSTTYYIIAAISALLQLIAWSSLAWLLFTKQLSIAIKSKAARILFILAGSALTIKLLLQTGSVFPALNQLVYGFRPIIVGYLHLVFLAIITVFIMGYLLQCRLLSTRRTSLYGILLFTAGIFLNEFGLMLQGICSLCNISVLYIPKLLFFASLIMLTGISIVNTVRLRTKIV